MASEHTSADSIESTPDASVVVDNALVVMEKIRAAASGCGRNPDEVNLVAVSKTKSPESIQALYDAGYRRFGENYVQELLDKAGKLPNDILWHFIGHLQSSKVPKLIRELPNLEVVETVDSVKLADKLNKACQENNKILQVFIQVDTSGEDTKSGVVVEELKDLASHIVNNCSALKLTGLMTSK